MVCVTVVCFLVACWLVNESPLLNFSLYIRCLQTLETHIDRSSVREAYNDVRNDFTDTNWYATRYFHKFFFSSLLLSYSGIVVLLTRFFFLLFPFGLVIRNLDKHLKHVSWKSSDKNIFVLQFNEAVSGLGSFYQQSSIEMGNHRKWSVA